MCSCLKVLVEKTLSAIPLLLVQRAVTIVCDPLWRGCVWAFNHSALRQLVCACAVVGVVGKRALRKGALVVVAVAVKKKKVKQKPRLL